jgi:molecular chaperone HscC
VALGVGVISGIKSRDESIKDIILTDICPFTLGVSMYDETSEKVIFSPIINRNTALPCSESQNYSPRHRQQKKVGFKIYQGESIELKENLYIGKLEVPLPKGDVSDCEIECRFSYDINGILEVEATVIDSGISRKEIIVTNSSLSEKEKLKRIKMLQKVKLESRENAKDDVLIGRAKRLFEENQGMAKNLIQEAYLQFIATLKGSSNIEKIKSREKFSSFLDGFEISTDDLFGSFYGGDNDYE